MLAQDSSPSFIEAGSGGFIRLADGSYVEACVRCGGSGKHSWNNEMQSDVCFRCGGTNIDPNSSAPINIERVYVIAGQRANAQARRDAKRQAEFEAGREQREQERIEREKLEAEAELKRSSWQVLPDAIGEGVIISGEIEYFIDIESSYGWTRLVVILVDETHRVKTFTSANWAFNIKDGERITLAATIKEHDNYGGELSTVVNRPKRLA